MVLVYRWLTVVARMLVSPDFLRALDCARHHQSNAAAGVAILDLCGRILPCTFQSFFSFSLRRGRWQQCRVRARENDRGLSELHRLQCCCAKNNRTFVFVLFTILTTSTTKKVKSGSYFLVLSLSERLRRESLS